MPNARLREHNQSHTRERRVQALQADRARAEEDKNNITVSGKDGIAFGVVEPGDENQFIELNITKTDPESRIALSNYKMSSAANESENGERYD